MRMRVSFVVDVDVDAWADEWGVDVSEVEDHVTVYARDAVLDAASIYAGSGN